MSAHSAHTPRVMDSSWMSSCSRHTVHSGDTLAAECGRGRLQRAGTKSTITHGRTISAGRALFISACVCSSSFRSYFEGPVFAQPGARAPQVRRVGRVRFLHALGQPDQREIVEMNGGG